MSKAWANGSTRHWRKVRQAVLDRDGHRCQLRHDCCTGRATEVHHVRGREVSGDDPADLLASCRACNIAVGDPRSTDPAPVVRTQW